MEELKIQPETVVTPKKGKLIVFDLDSIIFTVAWKYKDRKTKKVVTMNTNKFIRDVLKNTEADEYVGFFGSKADDAAPNFRYSIDPEYKANRPPTPEFVKKWRPTIIEAFEGWGFVGVDGMEADDAVAIAVEKYRDDYEEIIVASFDKDLKQIPNITYYYMKEHKVMHINKFEAAKNLCTQMLTGDTTDNIKGLPGVGPKGAEKLLSEAKTIHQLVGAVIGAYREHGEKQQAKLFAEASKAVQEDYADNYNFKTKSAKQQERIIRIETKKRLKTIEQFDWKAYFKKENSLLTMLTVEPDWFKVPEPIKSKVKEEILKRKAVEESMDDFLTV